MHTQPGGGASIGGLAPYLCMCGIYSILLPPCRVTRLVCMFFFSHHLLIVLACTPSDYFCCPGPFSTGTEAQASNLDHSIHSWSDLPWAHDARRRVRCVGYGESHCICHGMPWHAMTYAMPYALASWQSCYGGAQQQIE